MHEPEDHGAYRDRCRHVEPLLRAVVEEPTEEVEELLGETVTAEIQEGTTEEIVAEVISKEVEPPEEIAPAPPVAEPVVERPSEPEFVPTSLESEPEPAPVEKAAPVTETEAPERKSQPTARELFSTILGKLDSIDARLAKIEDKLEGD